MSTLFIACKWQNTQMLVMCDNSFGNNTSHASILVAVYLLPIIEHLSFAELDECLTGDQEVAGLQLQSGTILSLRLIMKSLLRSFSPFSWFKKGSCQLLAKDCALSTGLSLPRKSVIRLTDHPTTTTAIDCGG